DAATQYRSVPLIEAACRLTPLTPMRAQCFETLTNAATGAEHLSGCRRPLSRQRILDPEFERIHTELFSQLIEKLVLREGGLRHTEAADRAGRNEIGVDGARQRPVMRHVVGTRGMDGHAVRPRRAPGGIWPGVSIGGGA